MAQRERAAAYKLARRAVRFLIAVCSVIGKRNSKDKFFCRLLFAEKRTVGVLYCFIDGKRSGQPHIIGRHCHLLRASLRHDKWILCDGFPVLRVKSKRRRRGILFKIVRAGGQAQGNRPRLIGDIPVADLFAFRRKKVKSRPRHRDVRLGAVRQLFFFLQPHLRYGGGGFIGYRLETLPAVCAGDQSRQDKNKR